MGDDTIGITFFRDGSTTCGDRTDSSFTQTDHSINGCNQIDGVTYDGAGNITNSGIFTYNADGRLISDRRLQSVVRWLAGAALSITHPFSCPADGHRISNIASNIVPVAASLPPVNLDRGLGVICRGLIESQLCARCCS